LLVYLVEKWALGSTNVVEELLLEIGNPGRVDLVQKS
jgi:hypothetical protein